MAEFNKIALFFLLSATTPLFAQEATPQIEEEITVKSSKDDIPLESLGYHVQVITAEDIAKHQFKTLADVLHLLPSISLTRNGGTGTLTTAFVRGSNSENTLVLMNGVRLNDPSTPGRGFEYNHLSVHNIERIEYLPGPQNALYGSDASAGLINIITREAAESFSTRAHIEGGTGESGRVSGGVSGSKDRFHYTVDVEYSQTEDVSAGFDPITRTTPEEEDRYENTTGTVSLGYRKEGLQLGADITAVDSTTDIDQFPFDFNTFAQNFADDRNSVYSYNQLSLRLFLTSTHMDGKWTQTLTFGRTTTEREENNPADEFAEFDQFSRFEGVGNQAEWRHNLKINPNADFTLGMAFDDETAVDLLPGEADPDADTLAMYAQGHFKADNGLSAVVAARYNDHSQFGQALTWQFSPVYRIRATGTRLYASVATGFKAPSLFQLNAAFFGNANLEEEESDSWEGGVEQSFYGGRLKVNLGYYETEYENLIDFLFNPDTNSFNYDNQPLAEMAGLEFSMRYQSKKFGAQLFYDNLYRARRRATSDDDWSNLVRRADDKLSLLLDYRFSDHLEGNLEAVRYGESTDFNFFLSPSPIEDLDAYTLVNMGLKYHFGESLSLSLRGENLGDEDYTQVIGYSVHGSRIFLGAHLRY